MDEGLPGFVVGILLGFLVGILLVGALAKGRVKDLKFNAVKHGCAEWVVDQKNGDTSFKWKEKGNGLGSD